MNIRACLGAVVGFSARARRGKGATTTTRKKELEVEREGGRNMTWVAAFLPCRAVRYVFGAAVNVNARGVKMVWETEEEKKSPIGMICRTGIYAWAGLEKALRGSMK